MMVAKSAKRAVRAPGPPDVAVGSVIVIGVDRLSHRRVREDNGPPDWRTLLATHLAVGLTMPEREGPINGPEYNVWKPH